MRNVDKYERIIYAKTFKKLLGYARKLEKLGYVESKRKPNLFYKTVKNIVFFVDIRGREYPPLWEDSSPIFYAKADGVEDWLFNRLVSGEAGALLQNGVPIIESYWLRGSGSAGYCKYCGKDHRGNSIYCSPECEKKDKAEKCEVCGAWISSFDLEYPDVFTLIEHHISYDPEVTIKVCPTCHNKIHHSDSYPELKPRDKPKRRFKLVPCLTCDKKARVPVDFEGKPICSNCKRKGCGRVRWRSKLPVPRHAVSPLTYFLAENYFRRVKE